MYCKHIVIPTLGSDILKVGFSNNTQNVIGRQSLTLCRHEREKQSEASDRSVE